MFTSHSVRTPTPKEREVKLQQDIARYDEGITAMQKNLKEVKRSRKNVIASIKKAEKRIANTSNDNADTKEKLEEEKQKFKAFDAFIIKKNKGFEEDMLALEELRIDIARQIKDVKENISVMSKESSEWAFANNLTTAVCAVAKSSAFSAYNRWIAAFPVIQIWMAMEAYSLAAIESTAKLEGLSEEILAHTETKHVLQQYSDQFRVLDYEMSLKTNSAEHLRNKQRDRSSAYRNIHVEELRKRSRLLNECERLKLDIARRLTLKTRLDNYMMELSIALDDDMAKTMNGAEKHAGSSLNVILSTFDAWERKNTPNNKHTAGNNSNNNNAASSIQQSSPPKHAAPQSLPPTHKSQSQPPPQPQAPSHPKPTAPSPHRNKLVGGGVGGGKGGGRSGLKFLTKASPPVVSAAPPNPAARKINHTSSSPTPAARIRAAQQLQLQQKEQEFEQQQQQQQQAEAEDRFKYVGYGYGIDVSSAAREAVLAEKYAERYSSEEITMENTLQNASIGYPPGGGPAAASSSSRGSRGSRSGSRNNTTGDHSKRPLPSSSSSASNTERRVPHTPVTYYDDDVNIPIVDNKASYKGTNSGPGTAVGEEIVSRNSGKDINGALLGGSTISSLGGDEITDLPNNYNNNNNRNNNNHNQYSTPVHSAGTAASNAVTFSLDKPEVVDGGASSSSNYNAAGSTPYHYNSYQNQNQNHNHDRINNLRLTPPSSPESPPFGNLSGPGDASPPLTMTEGQQYNNNNNNNSGRGSSGEAWDPNVFLGARLDAASSDEEGGSAVLLEHPVAPVEPSDNKKNDTYNNSRNNNNIYNDGNEFRRKEEGFRHSLELELQEQQRDLQLQHQKHNISLAAKLAAAEQREREIQLLEYQEEQEERIRAYAAARFGPDQKLAVLQWLKQAIPDIFNSVEEVFPDVQFPSRHHSKSNHTRSHGRSRSPSPQPRSAAAAATSATNASAIDSTGDDAPHWTAVLSQTTHKMFAARSQNGFDHEQLILQQQQQQQEGEQERQWRQQEQDPRYAALEQQLPQQQLFPTPSSRPNSSSRRPQEQDSGRNAVDELLLLASAYTTAMAGGSKSKLGPNPAAAAAVTAPSASSAGTEGGGGRPTSAKNATNSAGRGGGGVGGGGVGGGGAYAVLDSNGNSSRPSSAAAITARTQTGATGGTIADPSPDNNIKSNTEINDSASAHALLSAVTEGNIGLHDYVRASRALIDIAEGIQADMQALAQAISDGTGTGTGASPLAPSALDGSSVQSQGNKSNHLGVTASSAAPSVGTEGGSMGGTGTGTSGGNHKITPVPPKAAAPSVATVAASLGSSVNNRQLQMLVRQHKKKEKHNSNKNNNKGSYDNRTFSASSSLQRNREGTKAGFGTDYDGNDDDREGNVPYFHDVEEFLDAVLRAPDDGVDIGPFAESDKALYVSLQDISVYEELTSAHVLRNMQQTTAIMSHETISKLTAILLGPTARRQEMVLQQQAQQQAQQKDDEQQAQKEGRMANNCGSPGSSPVLSRRGMPIQQNALPHQHQPSQSPSRVGSPTPPQQMGMYGHMTFAGALERADTNDNNSDNNVLLIHPLIPSAQLQQQQQQQQHMGAVAANSNSARSINPFDLHAAGASTLPAMSSGGGGGGEVGMADDLVDGAGSFTAGGAGLEGNSQYGFSIGGGGGGLSIDNQSEIESLAHKLNVSLSSLFDESRELLENWIMCSALANHSLSKQTLDSWLSVFQLYTPKQRRMLEQQEDASLLQQQRASNLSAAGEEAAFATAHPNALRDTLDAQYHPHVLMEWTPPSGLGLEDVFGSAYKKDIDKYFSDSITATDPTYRGIHLASAGGDGGGEERRRRRGEGKGRGRGLEDDDDDDDDDGMYYGDITSSPRELKARQEAATKEAQNEYSGGSGSGGGRNIASSNVSAPSSMSVAEQRRKAQQDKSDAALHALPIHAVVDISKELISSINKNLQNYMVATGTMLDGIALNDDNNNNKSVTAAAAASGGGVSQQKQQVVEEEVRITSPTNRSSAPLGGTTSNSSKKGNSYDHMAEDEEMYEKQHNKLMFELEDENMDVEPDYDEILSSYDEDKQYMSFDHNEVRYHRIFPEEETVLNSMESIIGGELYVLTFTWVPRLKVVQLLAKSYVDKNNYKQYIFHMNSHVLGKVMATPRKLLGQVFRNTGRLCSKIVSCLTIQTLQHQYMPDLLEHTDPRSHYIDPSTHNLEIDKMIDRNIITLSERPDSSGSTRIHATSAHKQQQQQQQHGRALFARARDHTHRSASPAAVPGGGGSSGSGSGRYTNNTIRGSSPGGDGSNNNNNNINSGDIASSVHSSSNNNKDNSTSRPGSSVAAAGDALLCSRLGIANEEELSYLLNIMTLRDHRSDALLAHAFATLHAIG